MTIPATLTGVDLIVLVQQNPALTAFGELFGIVEPESIGFLVSESGGVISG